MGWGLWGGGCGEMLKERDLIPQLTFNPVFNPKSTGYLSEQAAGYVRLLPSSPEFCQPVPGLHS